MAETGKSSGGSGAPGRADFTVVGGGILGLAVARELRSRHREADVVVLERENDVGRHQTANNSGVIHAGIYYAPGSLKAKLCVEGARRMYEYCDAHGIRAERTGKVIVATDAAELPALDELQRRAEANGVPGVRRLGPEELAELEPHVTGIAALHSPNTGIVDFGAVTRALRAGLEAEGAPVVTGAGVESVENGTGGVSLRHARGVTTARHAIFCAGAAADRLAIADGAGPDPRIVPFRGTYLKLREERESLVRSLVYPVPDPRLPFLGVHLTRHPRGGVLVGPTALLVPQARSLAWPGTWRMMRRFWRTGLTEMHHAVSRAAIVRAAQRFVPDLRTGDVEPAWHGERAQALGRDGKLFDDFAFSETERSLHVRNAPSPAATSSLAIAVHVADRFESAFL